MIKEKNMNDKSAEFSDLIGSELNGKSDALKNLDRTAFMGISALAAVTLFVISLIFFSL